MSIKNVDEPFHHLRLEMGIQMMASDCYSHEITGYCFAILYPYKV